MIYPRSYNPKMGDVLHTYHKRSEYQMSGSALRYGNPPFGQWLRDVCRVG